MNIIVNATALTTSGALNILHQFLSEIPNNDDRYIIFVDVSLSLEVNNENVQLVYRDSMSLITRFFWDLYGVKYWIKRNEFIPSISISLQNTNFNTGFNIPNFVYYHQPIPFFKNKWNPFKKNERRLWFYKSIYPFFVNFLLKNNTEFFVQLNTIKDSLNTKYGIDKAKIHVVRPNVLLPTATKLEGLNLDKKNINIFYPATALVYKNHNILFDALLKLPNEMKPRVCLYLTCTKEDLRFHNIQLFNSCNIVFMGSISYSKVIAMFNEVDALVFPSYIETFGLPLIEAASLKCRILAADIPYAREVLANYNGVSFLPFNDSDLWSKGILNINTINNKNDIFFEDKTYKSWEDFFEIIKK